jgi:hypothetical protein
VSSTLVDRASEFLESRLSRRNFINRSAFVGSALAVGGVEFALHPGTAYGAICSCGDLGCDCGSTCCSGFSEFCCVLNGGYNYCPTGTVIGGWWQANGSAYCSGPRYYLDCSAQCNCLSGCTGGFPFCDTSCDGTNCTCALESCANYLNGCLQFRYGQCNQQIACMGRIVCRVVSCIPPWEVDPTCTTALAEDDSTANMNRVCTTAVPTPPPPPVPPPPPCFSPATMCETVGMASSTDGGGYMVVTAFGKVFTFGDAANDGDVSGEALNAPIVGTAVCPTQNGYWLVASDGGVFAIGAAPFLGSMGGQHLNQPIVGMAATPSGNGYWLVASDGGIFTFGDAKFLGSEGGSPLNQPVVGMAATPSGNGYWLVASDGGIFTFGDAPFLGSEGGSQLNQPVVGMAATPSGNGYWLVASDGGIFTFGDAPFDGSEGGQQLNRPMVGMAAVSNGSGYWTVAQDGGIFTFDSPFLGSPA